MVPVHLTDGWKLGDDSRRVVDKTYGQADFEKTMNTEQAEAEIKFPYDKISCNVLYLFPQLT